MPQQITDWTDLSVPTVPTYGSITDWQDINTPKYQDEPATIDKWLSTVDKYNKPLIDLTPYTNQMAKEVTEHGNPTLSQAAIMSMPAGLGEIAQRIMNEPDPNKAMGRIIGATGSTISEQSSPLNVAALLSGFGAEELAARYGIGPASKALMYTSKAASVPIAAAGMRGVTKDIGSEEPWNPGRFGELGMHGLEALMGTAGVLQRMPGTWSKKVAAEETVPNIDTPPPPPPSTSGQMEFPFMQDPAFDQRMPIPPPEPHPQLPFDQGVQGELNFGPHRGYSGQFRSEPQPFVRPGETQPLLSGIDPSISYEGVSRPFEVTKPPVPPDLPPDIPPTAPAGAPPTIPPAAAAAGGEDINAALRKIIEDTKAKAETAPATTGPDTVEFPAGGNRLDMQKLVDEGYSPTGRTGPGGRPLWSRAATTEAPVAAAAKAAEDTTDVFSLPRELQGARPRYKNYELDFENDLDKALYIIAKETPSKRDSDYLKLVMEYFNTDEAGARAYGREVKANIAEQVKGEPSGVVKLDKITHIEDKVPTESTTGLPKSWEKFAEGETITVPKEVANTKGFLERLKAEGIRYLGKDADGNAILQRLKNDAAGEWRVGKTWEELKGIARRLRGTEGPAGPLPSSMGRVAPFEAPLKPGEVRPMNPKNPRDIALDRNNDFMEARSIKDIATAEENVKHWQDRVNRSRLAGNRDELLHSDGILGVAERQLAKLKNQAGVGTILSNKPLPGEAQGPIGVVRTRSQLEKISEASKSGKPPLPPMGGSDTGAIEFGPTPPNPKKVVIKRGVGGEPAKLKGPSWGQEAFNFARGITTTWDLSAPLRQGLPLIFTKAWRSSWKQMIESFGSEGAYQKTLADLRSRPLFAEHTDLTTGRVEKSFAEKAGMRLMDLTKDRLNNAEESLVSNWAETGAFLGKDTIGRETGLQRGFQKSIGRFSRASNRAYTAYLNQLRADTFENLVRDAERMAKADTKIGGKSVRNPMNDIPAAKEIADFVNTATGRGPMRMNLPGPKYETVPGGGGKLTGVGIKEYSLEQHTKAISNLLFSPRLFASRVRMLNPLTYTMASPLIRKQYINALLSVVGAGGGVATLAKMAGADVSTDWTSADFGKIRVGGTRIDPYAGFQQYAVLASKLLSGHTESSNTNRDTELGAGFQATTRLDVIHQFGANKLHPIVKFAHDWLDASQYQPFGVADRTAQLFVPLIVGDILELSKSDPKMLPWLAPIIAGAGSQTYAKGESLGKFIDPSHDWMFQGGQILPNWIQPDEQ